MTHRADTVHTASLGLNLLLYQLGWFACVLGAANGRGGLGAGIALVLTAAHLVLAARPRREWPLLLGATLLGAVVETLQASFGVLELPNHRAGSFAPLWIVALWLQFGTLFHFGLRWLSRRYLLAALLGLAGGPLAFLAGERLGAARFGEPRMLSIAALAGIWAVSLPLLARLADRFGWAGRYRIFTAGRDAPRRVNALPATSVAASAEGEAGAP